MDVPTEVLEQILERRNDDDTATDAKQASEHTGNRSRDQHRHNQARQIHTGNCTICRIPEPSKRGLAGF